MEKWLLPKQQHRMPKEILSIPIRNHFPAAGIYRRAFARALRLRAICFTFALIFAAPNKMLFGSLML
jgi:hypothetical protein